jgi:spore coat protein A
MAGVFLLNNKSIFSKNLPDLRENLQPFIDSLPIPLKTEVSRENRYILTMTEGFHRFHRAFLKSRVWGFNGGYLGPTIEVEPYKSISVLWQNKLPKKHLFTIDHRIHGAGYEVPDVRTVVHVHGAKTYDVYDGYPEDWFLPDDEGLYKYPNEQEAATLWYHDHALGNTRLNVYAGLLGFYLIKDYIRDEKFGFRIGKKYIPFLIQDKIFNKFGQINYAESFEPEVYGDYNVVNGKIWPYFEVEPVLYRFRLLNASNARFYNLFLEGLPIYQIATERGLLKNFEKLKN